MPMIEFEWEMKLPNDYLVDHSQSQNKTRTAVYDGPDKIYLIVNNETGKEDFGPITEEEKNDGRPIPEGCRYVEVDCLENPLVCQLRAPVIDEAEEEYEEEFAHPQSPLIEGYPQLTVQYPLMARDVYDGMDLTIDKDNNITVPVRSIANQLFGHEQLPTWDEVRKTRNRELANTDGKIDPDMPQEIQDKWKNYRKLLRDMPEKLKDVPPHIAILMMPLEPGTEILPENGDDLF